jgi:rRNA maturation RNase YbeY
LEEIAYHFQTEFSLDRQREHTDWIIEVIKRHGAVAGTLNVIFVSDDKLLEMNKMYLNHDYYTDIITFQYTELEGVSGDLFVSTDRVLDNAEEHATPLDVEVRRVMVHGVLHLMGFNDTTKAEKLEIRRLENEALEMFHVKHGRNVQRDIRCNCCGCRACGL